MDLRADLQAALGSAYTIERELGGGGMSHLFVARDESLGRDVVVKVVAVEGGGRLSVERFRREVALAASLQHPHIVAVLSAGDVDGLPYFLMPYVEGQSLRVRLDEQGALSVRETVAVLRDVARALAYAHERGVVHRDIKPDNVLLAGGSAMLNDFGIAKALASARASTDGRSGALTQEGYALGTPGYMAPEQVAGDPNVDHRADIYAFGVLAYEMLTGHTPFHGHTPHEQLTRQLTTAPPPIAEARAGLAAPLADLVMQCLERSPAKRPASANALVQALDDPGIVSGPQSVSTLVMPATARRWRWVAAVGGAMAVFAGLGAWMLLRGTVEASAAPSSIAVLPLDLTGDDSTTAYFAEGLTDEITLALSRLPGVRVVSPSAASAFRGRDVPLAEVGQRLRVATLLEGSIQVSGGRLRLQARLTDAREGRVLWLQRFETDVRDVFAVQDSIATAIASALADRFGGTPPPVAAVRGTQGTGSVEAYDAFLRGRFHFQRRTPEALTQAIVAFREAIERDPGFARAYAGLADAYGTLPLYSNVRQDSLQGLALQAVEQALALDSTLSDALASRGLMRMQAWRWSEAENDLLRAVRSDSTNVNAWQWMGEWLLYNGRPDEAAVAFARAGAVAPTVPLLPALRALALAAARRPAEAFAEADRSVALDSTLAVTHYMRSAVYLYGGRPADAVRELETVRRLGISGPTPMGLLGAAYGLAGNRTRAEGIRDSLLAQAGVPGATAALAHVNIGLGDTAQALTWLEWAAGAHDAFFASQPLVAPLYDPIRGSERFASVVRRVGLDAARVN